MKLKAWRIIWMRQPYIHTIYAAPTRGRATYLCYLVIRDFCTPYRIDGEFLGYAHLGQFRTVRAPEYDAVAAVQKRARNIGYHNTATNERGGCVPELPKTDA